MQAAHDEHEFLRDNKYISLDLLELQEMLIRAGLLQPDEKVIRQAEDAPLDEATFEANVGALGMDAAVEVFYDLVLNYHPDVLSP